MGLIPELPLARFAVDRCADMRSNPNWLSELWPLESTRVLQIFQGEVPVTDDLSLVLQHSHTMSLPDPQTVFLLGVDEQHAYLAVVIDAATDAGTLWISARDFGAQLSTRDVGLVITATALVTWHRLHTFCPKCGEVTTVTEAGWSRRCATDDITHFPRTEPAIIVAVEDIDERILLGRRANWPANWFSTLAGFVEAGESSEAAVIREVREESGIELDEASLDYVGSQPWPFPASLMLGYRARAKTTQVRPDGEEIVELRWFTRDELASQCQAELLKLPNRAAIAWHMIEQWYGQPLEPEWTRA